METAREFAESLEIEDLEAEWDEWTLGQVCAWLTPDGPMLRIVRPPDLHDDSFVEWARTRAEMFLTVGPETDGWFERTDGGWQIQGRSVYAPALDEDPASVSDSAI